MSKGGDGELTSVDNSIYQDLDLLPTFETSEKREDNGVVPHMRRSKRFEEDGSRGEEGRSGRVPLGGEGWNQERSWSELLSARYKSEVRALTLVEHVGELEERSVESVLLRRVLEDSLSLARLSSRL